MKKIYRGVYQINDSSKLKDTEDICISWDQAEAVEWRTAVTDMRVKIEAVSSNMSA